MQVSIFKSLLTAIPQKTSLEQIVHIIRTSRYLQQLTEEARMLYDEGKKADADAIKKGQLPAFAPAAALEEGKSRECLTGLTGLCFIDIDHINDKQMYKALAMITGDEHTLLAYRSVSGHGLHIIVRYQLAINSDQFQIALTPSQMKNLYGTVFKTVAFRYRELLGLPVDKSGANPERLCLISYDDAAIFHPEAKPLVYKYLRRTTARLEEIL